MSRKLVQINTVFYASTGKIMGEIQKYAEQEGYETISFAGRPPVTNGMKSEMFGNPVAFWSHVALTTVFDAQGYGSYFSTKKLIKRLREEQPDIIHLHNLHGYYLNIPLLCKYLTEEFQGKIFWTFHDCWPVTGHCAHFASINCSKWETGCYQCKKKKEYPISLFWDGAKRNYEMKKKLFMKIPNLTIIVPSEWMKQNIERSFLADKKIEVVSNGIDLNTFALKQDAAVWNKYNIPTDKKIILGVSSVWSKSKGLNTFLGLRKVLSTDYCIVLVGLSKRQIRMMPEGIVGIERTENKEELVKIYSNADVFVNPSVEESFSLVTVEAMACGTPVVVLDTSAVKELVCEECGIVLDKYTTQDYVNAIQMIENKKLEKYQIRACAQKYSVDNMVSNIINLYDKSMEG